MSLDGIEIKEFYSSARDSLMNDFYLPCLDESIEYKRAVGYFSSAVLVLLQSSLSDFIERNGRIKIICSPNLSEDDAQAIHLGSNNARESTLKSLMKDIDNLDNSFGANVPSSLLRKLTSLGIVDFRIAIPNLSKGVYHPKIGIFRDQQGNEISFNGSNNETFMGWSDLGNPESFDTFKSWQVPERVLSHKSEFEDTWNGSNTTVKMYQPSEFLEVFQSHNNDLSLDECLLTIRSKYKYSKTKSKTRNSKISLQEHQSKVLSDWESHDKKGIVQFVTGGGKTITALFAARDWLSENKPVLILVPARILHDYWRDEIYKVLGFDTNIIFIGNNSKKENWKTVLRSVFSHGGQPKPYVFLATYQSAKSDEFLQLMNDCSNLLLIADEVHNLGAEDTSRIMDRMPAPARLGLSATYQRYGDESGTQRLINYFLHELEPKFEFSDAVQAGRLVPYEYKINLIEFNETEEESFDMYTRKMINAFQWKDGKKLPTQLSQYYARERAKVVKEVSGKNSLAVKILSNAKQEDRWLVYCNSINHLNLVKELLGSANIDCSIYHSQMEGDRFNTLEYFEKVGGILLSIKCLDEGVDIPILKSALILASSSNPREYIQRRGRALRTAPGKNFATIHDVIVTRADGCPALISEVRRGMSMAANAVNQDSSIEISRLIDVWTRKYGDLEPEEYDMSEQLGDDDDGVLS